MQPLDIPENRLPEHLAIVMDGNGRWAKQRKKPRAYGHQQGVVSARDIVEYCGRLGIKALTLFAFSSENWNRPEKEVSFLMQLFIKALHSESKKLNKNNVCMKVIGDVSGFDLKLQKTIKQAEQLTAENTGLKLYVAANYGGRWDLVAATKVISEKVRAGDLLSSEIDEDELSRHLCLNNAPQVDLFIRTGGESRISNFLLWQIAYAELFFSEALWPDFGANELSEMIKEFAQRERRFGRISEQLELNTSQSPNHPER